MEQWTDLVNTAMLGTDKRPLLLTGHDGPLQDAAVLIQAGNADKEEQFLQLTALAQNYRQCGATAYPKAQVTPTLAPPEDKPYCSPAAILALQDVLHSESNGLLRLWLRKCNEYGRLVTPELLPALLNTAIKSRELRADILTAAGKRGEWLGTLNEEWNLGIGKSATAEEQWLTGDTGQRRAILDELRLSNPIEAVNKLQQTWNAEPAEVKQALLGALFVNAGDADLPFLESLEKDKSKKVKEQAMDLLKRIPASSIIQQYTQLALQGFVIREEKKLLGLSSKQVLSWQLPAIPDSIYKSGIEKMTSQKNINDEDYVLYQLVMYTPPHHWEQHFNSDPAKILSLFRQDSKSAWFIPALSQAAARFRNKEWASLLIREEKYHYDQLLNLIPPAEKEKFLLANLKQMAADGKLISAMPMEEWSTELANALLDHAARNPYQFTRPFYKENADRFPLTVLSNMEKKFAVEEEYLKNAWTGYADFLKQLLAIKQQTLNAFNA